MAPLLLAVIVMLVVTVAVYVWRRRDDAKPDPLRGVTMTVMDAPVVLEEPSAMPAYSPPDAMPAYSPPDAMPAYAPDSAAPNLGLDTGYVASDTGPAYTMHTTSPPSVTYDAEGQSIVAQRVTGVAAPSPTQVWTDSASAPSVQFVPVVARDPKRDKPRYTVVESSSQPPMAAEPEPSPGWTGMAQSVEYSAPYQSAGQTTATAQRVTGVAAPSPTQVWTDSAVAPATQVWTDSATAPAAAAPAVIGQTTDGAAIVARPPRDKVKPRPGRAPFRVGGGRRLAPHPAMAF